MKWTSTGYPTQYSRLGDVHWMLEQVHTLLAMQHQLRVVLGQEGYIGHPEAGFDRAITMSAWTAHPEEPAGVLGAKWVTSCVANTKDRGLPRGRAVTILNCAETGLPLLAFDGTDLSNARTAIFACASIALLHKDPQRIVLLGAGRVHAWQARYIRQLWPKAKLCVYDPDRVRTLCFERAHQVDLLHDGESALEFDVVSFATAGSKDGWILDDAPLPKDALWINTSLRDITPHMVSRFATVVVDDLVLAASQNTPYHTCLLEGNVPPTWRLCDAPIGLASPILVNPMGMALWDVGIGYMLFQEEYRRERATLTQKG